MRRFLPQLILAALVAASLAPNLWSADGKGKGSKTRATVSPPKWKREVIDAFFPDATAALSGERPDFGAARAVVNAGGGTPGATSDGGGGDSFAWSGLISSDTLEAAIKSHTAELGELIKEPGTFKSSKHRDARRIYCETAVLFGVISRYDGDVRWKDKAAGMREGVARAANNCKVGTDASFNESRERQKDMAELIRGGSVTLPEVGDQAEWKTASERPPLMQRMEELGQKHLKTWTSSNGEFNANKEKIIQEAQILATLAQVITDPSYDYADDAQYLEFIKALQQGCQDMVAGAQQGDYDKASAGSVAINKACADCHTNFR
ncbi:MAG: hypothetical protein AB7O62_07800 [Pirellulales bacterium]